MDHYVRIWSTVYDGTLREDPDGMNTFLHLLILADAEGVVDMTPQAIAGRTGQPLDALRRGLAFLAAPDPASRTATEDGRRIVLLDPARDWGWRIVNFADYRRRGASPEHKRAMDAERQRRRRSVTARDSVTKRDNTDADGQITPVVQNVTPGSRKEVVGKQTEEKDKDSGEEPGVSLCYVDAHGRPADRLDLSWMFPLKRKGVWCGFSLENLEELKRMHPGVDVEREAKAMHAWCLSQGLRPGGGKLKVHPWAFVTGWLRREMKRQAPGGGDRTRADQDWARREA